MAGEINEERGQAYYSEHYQSGGWKYSFWKEYFWHRRHVLKRFGLKRGMRMLEVACGNGFHTDVFNRMGLDCIGVDRSQAGIEWATAHYPRWTYHCRNLWEMEFTPESFDVILARGLSHYHYDLQCGTALDTTETLIRYLKPGGVFIMIILTNLSGSREPNKVWHNTLDDYRGHFSSFGLEHSVEWVNGMAICAIHRAPEPQASACAASPASPDAGQTHLAVT